MKEKQKSIRSILRLVLVLFGVCGITLFQKPVSAQTAEDFYITYQGHLLYYVGEATDVVIPEGVVLIRDGAFEDKAITSVVFPSTMETVGTRAFNRCYSLERVELNEGLSSISDQAFYGCSALKEIILPDTVTYIGKEAFGGCRKLDKIVMPQNLEVIQTNTFRECGAKEITWPTGLLEIQGNAFYKAGMTELLLPKGVETINDNAFSECQLLEKVTISSTVTNLGPLAFNGCTKLTSVTVKSGNTIFSSYKGVVYDKAQEKLIFAPAGKQDIVFPATVKAIGPYAFNKSSMTSITLPEGITKIQKYAFAYSSLEDIVFPSTLKTIGKFVFSSTHISKISLPMNVKTIEPGAFSLMSKLTEIVIDADNPYFSIYGNGLYTKDKTTLVAYPGALTSATLHKNTEVIADNVFYGSKIQEIVLKKKLISIGAYAFYSSDLTSITIPDTVTQIGAHAFANTGSLKEVHLSNSLTVIPERAFQLSKVENINFPKGLTSIEAYAFAFSSISAVEFPSTLKSIGERAFYNCNRIYELTIPGNVKVIGEKAFSENYRLKQLILEEGLEEIQKEAFTDCDRLNNVVVPRSVKILDTAFSYAELDWILIPEGTKVLGDTFYTCKVVYGANGSSAEQNCKEYDHHFIAVVYPFIDVYPGNWYEKVVNSMRENKLIMGTSSVTFSPEQTMTRGQLMTILWRMEGSPKTTYRGAFTDVTADRYCAAALQWGKDQGLAMGMKDGSFHPDEGVNREQFMIFLYRYAAFKKYDMSIKGMTYTACADANKVSAYAATAVEWAYERGFIAADGKLNPQGKATRIQASAMLMRFIEKYR